MNENFPEDQQRPLPPEQAAEGIQPPDQQGAIEEAAAATPVTGEDQPVSAQAEPGEEAETGQHHEQPSTLANIDAGDGHSDDHGDGQVDESEGWDMAHDEEYRREGKTEFLGEPKEVKLSVGSHRTEALDQLYEAYLKGEHVFIDFNGQRMSSREIGELGLDGAYEKHFGYDKENYKEHERLESAARSAQYDLEQFEATYKAKKEVPRLIAQSADLINPDTAGEWRGCLESRATDIYKGTDSRAAVNLMRAHSQGASQEELRQMLDNQGQSGMSHGMTMAIIKHFYRAGDALVEMLQ